MCLGNSRARIPDEKGHALLIFTVEANRDLSSGGHRLDCIHDKVAHCLLDLVVVHRGRAVSAGRLHRQQYPSLTRHRLEQLVHAPTEFL